MRKFAALRTLGIAALTAAFAGPALADSWAAPQVREVFSASRDHFVRVIPGTSIGDTMGFAGAAKGKYAAAEFYQRQADRSYKLMHSATLLNPVAPVDIFLSNDGRLVTVDNWHNRGYGSVLAVYDAGGRLVKAYALTDLFSKPEIDRYPHSVSSRMWHSGLVYLNHDQRTLYLMIASGRDLVLGLTTGRFAVCEPRGGKPSAATAMRIENGWVTLMRRRGSDRAGGLSAEASVAEVGMAEKCAEPPVGSAVNRSASWAGIPAWHWCRNFRPT